MRRFAAVDLAEEVLLALLEEVVGELPSVRDDLSETLQKMRK